MAQRQLNLPVMKVGSLDTDPSIGCRVEVNEVDGLGALLRDAQDDAHVQHKTAAISAGYHEDYWTRVLNSERGVYLNRLGQLPEPVQRAFVARWARQLQMRVSDEDARTRAIADLARAAVHALSEIA